MTYTMLWENITTCFLKNIATQTSERLPFILSGKSALPHVSFSYLFRGTFVSSESGRINLTDVDATTSRIFSDVKHFSFVPTLSIELNELQARYPLNDGSTMPCLGLGVYRMTPEEAYNSTRAALSCGYRLIDTARLHSCFFDYKALCLLSDDTQI